jgi:hypothetical protein
MQFAIFLDGVLGRSPMLISHKDNYLASGGQYAQQSALIQRPA